jgi:transposase
LVVDNAAVYTGKDFAEVLDDILVFFQVRLAFLPAYSPELNPCELVFSLIKQDIRNLMGGEELLD